MKISEIIAKLQEIQKQDGDLGVWYDQYDEIGAVCVTTLGDLAEWADGEQAKKRIVCLS